ncbi:MAG TPA: uracil-DNA glycosylase [Bacilli bacterium]|jgi:uracil-DNA glycosylase|nr:MAG: Uracil-DNA glycosylase [Tenericutes bacterium ADurb.Bin140]HOE78505.1 uracil-DNA glycosylase [Bacilli bacterium]HPK58305.1 uracil-DNA glycosylase [Bacilli bacterium]HPX20921.1 uracil-DNA glycosylase [Bacilli bacterium]
MVNSWEELILQETKKPYWDKLAAFIQEEEKHFFVFPPRSYRFMALELTPLDKVKVVILGQDPYPGYGQANGLAFSVNRGIEIPRSLQNIFQEMINDVHIPVPHHGDLSCLARQGVLLLNTVLSVREGAPLSHADKGWEHFTDEVIKTLNEQNRKIVFMLWGNKAIAKKHLLTNPNHLILTAPHPSPLSASRGFFGCRHFSQANAFLGDQAIDWRII